MSGYESFASFYDVLTRNIDYQKRALYFDGLVKKYGENRGGILLDLACGTGSMSVEFTNLGYDVIGVDASDEMLSAAYDKKAEKNINSILYLCQPMEELDLYGTIDVAVCALDSLNHILETDALEMVFQRVSLFLNPGGLFLFDVNTIYKHEQVLANNSFVYDCPEVTCVWQNSLESKHIVRIDLSFFRKEESNLYRRFDEQFRERAYAHEDLCRIIETAGLSLLAVYEEDSFDPPKEKSERLIYVTKKV